MIIRLKEKIKSVCGKYEAFKGEPMDVIKYDERLEIYHCKTRFTKDDSIVYEVCKESAEVVQEQKPAGEGYPSKIRMTKNLEDYEHLEIREGDTFVPIKITDDFYFVSLLSGILEIPKVAAEVIETKPVEQDYKGDNIHETLAAREANYGRFADQAELSQQFKNIAHSAAKWDQLPADMKESIDMICHKMARVLNGKGAEYADNWHDIAGYATLVEDRLNEL